VGENVAMQQGWSLPVPIDVLEMWSEPVANEGLNCGFSVALKDTL
jgi:hypothetical protein